MATPSIRAWLPMLARAAATVPTYMAACRVTMLRTARRCGQSVTSHLPCTQAAAMA